MMIPHRLAALAFASVLVTGCGGGGGATSAPAAQDPLNATLSRNGAATTLANADFSLTRSACATFTLTPTSAADAGVLFEEKTDVDTTPAPDNDTQFRFRGAFLGPLQFAVNPASTLVHIIVFDASGKQLTEVKAPIASITGAACAGTPSAAPSPTASPDDNGLEPQPEATPTAKPTATATPKAR